MTMTKKSEFPRMVIGPRLKQCFDAGDVLKLFPVLSRWTQDELRALEHEIAAWLESADATLNAIHGEEALRVENFFSPSASKSLDKQIAEKRMELTHTAAEIYSVLYCYLEEPTPACDEEPE